MFELFVGSDAVRRHVGTAQADAARSDHGAERDEATAAADVVVRRSRRRRCGVSPSASNRRPRDSR